MTTCVPLGWQCFKHYLDLLLQHCVLRSQCVGILGQFAAHAVYSLPINCATAIFRGISQSNVFINDFVMVPKCSDVTFCDRISLDDLPAQLVIVHSSELWRDGIEYRKWLFLERIDQKERRARSRRGQCFPDCAVAQLAQNFYFNPKDFQHCFQGIAFFFLIAQTLRVVLFFRDPNSNSQSANSSHGTYPGGPICRIQTYPTVRVHK